MHAYVCVCPTVCPTVYNFSNGKPKQLSLTCPTHSLTTPPLCGLALPPPHFRLMKMTLNRRHTTEKTIPKLARTVITANRMTFMVVSCGLGMPPESRRQINTVIMRMRPMYIHIYMCIWPDQCFCNYNPKVHSTEKQGAALYVQYVRCCYHS